MQTYFEGDQVSLFDQDTSAGKTSWAYREAGYIELLEKKKTASFTLTPKLWIEKTKAIGIASKQGKGGGTFAHPMIGCEFASWISPEFKMLLLKLSLGREQVR